MREHYFPSEDEKKQGRWAIVEEEESRDVHVVPTSGKPHQLGKMCWCEPVGKHNAEFWNMIWVHKAVQ